MQNLELGVYITGFRYDPRSEVYGSQDPRETALNLVRPRVGMSGNLIWWIGPDALEACPGDRATLAMMCHSDDIVIGGEREVVMTCFQCCEYGGYG